MHGLIDFYDDAPRGQPDVIQRGEIYEDQPIYLPARHGIRIRQTDPVTNRITEMELTGRTEDIFDHPPIVSPKLPHGEALIVGQAKWARPVIVLAGEGFDLLAGPGIARASQTFLCAPITGATSSVRRRGGGSGRTSTRVSSTFRSRRSRCFRRGSSASITSRQSAGRTSEGGGRRA